MQIDEYQSIQKVHFLFSSLNGAVIVAKLAIYLLL